MREGLREKELGRPLFRLGFGEVQVPFIPPLKPCSSKCGPKTSITDKAWEAVRNAGSRASSPTYGSKSVFSRSPRYLCAQYSSRSAALNALVKNSHVEAGLTQSPDAWAPSDVWLCTGAPSVGPTAFPIRSRA